MRLTEKNATMQGTTIGFPNAIACYWKLKDLEDIEEELGIDLVAMARLFKQMKDDMELDYMVSIPRLTINTELALKDKEYELLKRWLEDE